MHLVVAEQRLLWATRRKMLLSTVGWQQPLDQTREDTLRSLDRRMDHAVLVCRVQAWEQQWWRSLWRRAENTAPAPVELRACVFHDFVIVGLKNMFGLMQVLHGPLGLEGLVA